MPNSCPGEVTIAVSAGEPSLGEDAPRKGKKLFQKGNRASVGHGPPKGNVNFAAGDMDKATAALFARLSARPAREKRDRDRRRGEEEARQIAKELQLDQHALGRRVCRRLVDVEQEIRHLAKITEHRGRFSTKGEPKSWYATYLKLQSEDRAELRRLVDDLRALPGSKDVSITSGPLSITIAPLETVEIPAPCACCGQIHGEEAGPPAQAPAQGDPLPSATDPASVEPDAVERPVAPRRLGDLFTVEPQPVVVEPRRHRGFRGFAKDEAIEDVPGDPANLQF